MQQWMAARARGFGTSIFSEMTALALQHGAINLSQGFPDFAGPAHVKQAAVAAIEADHNQYAPAPGLPALREAIAATYRASYGLPCRAEHVTVTSGATEAIASTMLALIDPGDEVLIFEPAYDSYAPTTVMAGGVPRFVRLEPPSALGGPADGDATRWWFDPAALQAACTPRTRAIIVNTPHNPTGKVFSRAELELIAELCRRHDLIAITDEVYDRLVYEGAHTPLATLPGMWERTVTINSTGKTFSLTGWKIGYTIAPPPLTDAIRRIHQFVTFAVATPFQHAMAAALTAALHDDFYARLLDFYRERRDRLTAILNQAGLAALPPEGTYFVMADIRGWGFTADVEFCRYLTTQVGVAAIPPSAFYAQPETAPALARFCFAKELATLEAAAARLRQPRAPVAAS